MEFSCRRLEFDDSPETEIDTGNVHVRILDEYIPKVGMVFETEEDAYKFYNFYAKNVGFSIRRSKARKDKQTKKVFDRAFCCSREGQRQKDKRETEVRCHRPETRCGCKAMMKVNCGKTGKYEVLSFVDAHNHELATPRKSQFLRSHRKMSGAQEALVDLAENSGINQKNSYELMSRQVGGPENLGFIPDDYKNYIRSKRMLQMRLGDTGGVLEYLQKMKSEDCNFFYAIQVDEDDLITNIFWADAKMMIDYAYFGDVISFDTTYRKHKDGRPIALFVGINHHKQTVIFGAALLYDETTETFKWLFATLARAMSGKKPMTILTDQDAAMAKALSFEWPETHHRLCIWHIYQNAAIHLSCVFSRFKEFAHDLGSCIYDYEEEDDFLNAWNKMLVEYDLEENDWLKRMFKVKEKWALVYGRNFFCADITTTQRSESMNSVVKKYVSYKHDILRFFHHFHRLVENCRYKELQADFKCTQSIPSHPPVRILDHAASVYSHEVFDLFLGQWNKSHDCKMEIMPQVGMWTKYKVTPDRRHYFHIVSYNSSNDMVLCSCKKFEFAGILCAHVLKVYTLMSVAKIPDNYILKRWTKNAKTGNVGISIDSPTNDDPKTLMAMRYRELCQLYTQLVNRASESDEAYKLTKEGFLKLREEVDATFADKVTEEPTPEFSNIVNVSEDTSVQVKGIKEKGKGTRKSSKRPRGALERAIQSKKQKRKSKQNLLENVEAESTINQASHVLNPLVPHLHSNQMWSNASTSAPYFLPHINLNPGTLNLSDPIERIFLPEIGVLTMLTQQSQSSYDLPTDNQKR